MRSYQGYQEYVLLLFHGGLYLLPARARTIKGTTTYSQTKRPSHPQIKRCTHRRSYNQNAIVSIGSATPQQVRSGAPAREHVAVNHLQCTVHDSDNYSSLLLRLRLRRSYVFMSAIRPWFSSICWRTRGLPSALRYCSGGSTRSRYKIRFLVCRL